MRTTFASGLFEPEGLAFDSAGNLFVADGGGVDKFTPTGLRTTFASGFKIAFALAFDSQGNLFVADGGDPSDYHPVAAAVFKFTPAGLRSTFAGPIGPGMDEVAFLAFQPTPTTSGSGRLQNISTRLRVETGDNVLIGGFIITGSEAKKVMVRAIGPSCRSTACWPTRPLNCTTARERSYYQQRQLDGRAQPAGNHRQHDCADERFGVRHSSES